MKWIKGRVNQITKKHKSNDPFKLATMKNIHVIQWDLHQEIKGFYKYDRRNKYIFINNNLDEISQKFVCAHELGHSQLHPRVNTPFLRSNTLYSVNKIEVEANAFAVELLMPDEFVNEYRNRNDNMTIKEVSQVYGIPEEVCHLKKI